MDHEVTLVDHRVVALDQSSVHLLDGPERPVTIIDNTCMTIVLIRGEKDLAGLANVPRRVAT